MEVSNKLVSLYATDSFVQFIDFKINENPKVQIKGLAGSLDAVLVSAHFKNHPKAMVVVLSDKEDAAYFYNDLLYLLGEESVFFFPMSYKKNYQYEEIDNANVLQRSEVLNVLNQADKNAVYVTYPEALSEKVINRKSLIANTLQIKIGDKFDLDFISDLLHSYDFERSDFVYEPGQFSVRGGIVDIFSYATEFPCRIELFGDEVDGLRYFNPATQLSDQQVSSINIIPDVQNKLTQETRESFFNFFKPDTLVWVKDVEFCLENIQNAFLRVKNDFEAITNPSGVQIVAAPEALFETDKDLLAAFEKFKTVEFGSRFYFKNSEKIDFQAKPQPSFNKDVKLLGQTLEQLQNDGFSNFITADSLKQLNRIQLIIEEAEASIQFQSIQISLREGFIDNQLKISCFTDHQIFDRFHKYRVRDKFSKSKAMTLKELKTLQPGDYVTHIDYGIGRFVGLEKVLVNDQPQEVICLIYRDNDKLHVSIHGLHKIAKYTGKEGSIPMMSKLGSPDWENKKSKAKRQVKDIAKELIALYAKRREAKGFAYSNDTFMQVELESSFIYEDTPDQAKATTDVKNDMEQQYPMDRLVCGDVGFGKTEIAVRAAFKAVADSKQVAILVPTTILAMQHCKTFIDRLGKFPVNIAEISRFKTAKEIKETLEAVKKGKVDILIGTHRILNKAIEFKDLGLMIIDEEQKFGVKAKDRLKEIKLNVDVLTLTATPIPRTLHFSLMGARDLSVIATPPANRQPVTTEMHVFQEEFIRDAIRFELKRGGQVFFVHNRVSDIESIANIILRLVPDAKISVGHGQMDPDRLEKVMVGFINGEADILISTNIIESGLDIPNANTMIINSAHMFGMSDLHQMRGRVGRSNKKAFCYMLTPPVSTLTRDARKRLQTLEEFSDLGDGFKVAMRDLDIRGAGNMLGAEQSGFITDLGYELYHKILDEAVQELKENEFKNLFNLDLPDDPFDANLPDCQLETDLPVLIPENYVSNISERLSLYNQLDNIKDEAELKSFMQSLEDRFGKIPEEARNLLQMVRVRWMAEMAGFEKLVLKNNILKGYFVSTSREDFYKSDNFGRVLDYINKHKADCNLGEFKNKPLLTVKNIQDIEQLKKVMFGLSGREFAVF
jgi:transcription-repair coupling factor (superfamily II helicase)